MTRVPGVREPVVLYRAEMIIGLRVLVLVLAAIAAAIPIALLIGILVAAREARTPALALLAWSGAGLILVLLAGGAVLLIRGVRSTFTVTTAGIEVRGLVSTVRIPWSDVAVIHVDPRHFHRGQALVIRRDGTQVGSSVTAARYAMRRGESTFDHGPELLHPAIPVRAAIDAHQRYLRGEFG